MKLIDMYREGRLIRFFIGKDECTDFYGENWDDIPNESSAGIVYEEFISGYVDVAVPFNMDISESGDNVYNSSVSRDMQKNHDAPLLRVRPSTRSINAEFYRSSSDYDTPTDRNSIIIWIGDKPEILDKIGIIIGKGEIN
jgi:hypothetical protein